MPTRATKRRCGNNDNARFPLAECIVHAIGESWSGQIDVLVGDKPVGLLVFLQGMVAWAVFFGQQETLGLFLLRLGRITTKDLRQAQEIYQANQGKKKLGLILEQLGVVQRPVLRRSLVLHTRQALRSLLALPEAVGHCLPGKLQADETIMFQPEEVLPLTLSTTVLKRTRENSNQSKEWRRLGRHNEVLRQFVELSHYRGSAIVSNEGCVVAAHLDSAEVDPYLFSVFIVTMLEASSRTVSSATLGLVETVTVECSSGCLVATWIDEEKRWLATILVAQEGNAGSAKVRLARSVPGLRSWIVEHAEQ